MIVGAYPAVFTIELGGFVDITFPDFPDINVTATFEEEARKKASMCLSKMVTTLLKSGKDIPIPSPCDYGRVLIYLSLETMIHLILFNIVNKDSKWTVTDYKLSNIEYLVELLDERGYQFVLDARKY